MIRMLDNKYCPLIYNRDKIKIDEKKYFKFK